MCKAAGEAASGAARETPVEVATVRHVPRVPVEGQWISDRDKDHGSAANSEGACHAANGVSPLFR